ncbi:MAG: primosomal protein N' [bacterium]|nr:primosomal protein N' [bacterium]
MKQLQVLIARRLEACVFDYLWDEKIPLEVGQVVRVPFGRSCVDGVVWSLEAGDKTFDPKRLKSIDELVEGVVLTPQILKFIKWVGEYTMTPLGAILKMVLGPKGTLDTPKRQKYEIHPVPLGQGVLPQLNPSQETVVGTLEDTVKKGGYQTFLLDGVTGSGKTEICFEALAQAIKEERQVLVLLPEISLSHPWVKRFEKRFGVKPALWNSNLTLAQRRAVWRAVDKGIANVVVGARSALFLPFQDLGLIVVDEEHDGSFKQEEGVIYNARDMAVVRAHLENVPLVLSSATPALETYINAVEGRYQHLKLDQRYGGAVLPHIEAINMVENPLKADQWLSEPLVDEIEKNLEKGKQSFLYLNRRGYAPLLLCRTCGNRLQCDHCSSGLVAHRAQNCVQCHWCGLKKPWPSKCSQCEQETLVPCGPGVERVEEEVRKRFPTARCKVVASDMAGGQKSLEEALLEIAEGGVDIVIGTQLLAKGHHFPNLTLVGIVDADLSLHGSDPRAGERTYQLLQQVAGRAGREKDLGRVLIQTYQPEHPVMEALVQGDRESFLEREIQERRLSHLPPFGRLIAIVVSSTREEQASTWSQALIRTMSQSPFEGVRILGPVPAPMSRVKRKYRWRILVQGPKEVNLQKVVRQWLKGVEFPSAVRVTLDVDPYSFL